VTPPLAGRVTQLKVGLGHRVEAGQALVVIDSPDPGTAYSDYDRAKVLLSLATETRNRLRALQKIGGAATKDLQQAETDYVTAEVEMERATAHLRQIGVDPDATNKSRTVTVVAPMAGSVIDLGVAPGEYWNDPTAAMMTVADSRPSGSPASVPEKDTSLVSKGTIGGRRIRGLSHRDIHGNVLFVSDVLDPTTRRTKGDHRLRQPGHANFTQACSRASVSSHRSRKWPWCRPARWCSRTTKPRVFVETSRGTFEARDVDIGFQQGNQATLTRGVKVGDRVVVSGGARSVIDWLVGFALRKRFVVAMICVFAAVYGYYSWTRLAIDAYPDVGRHRVADRHPGARAGCRGSRTTGHHSARTRT